MKKVLVLLIVGLFLAGSSSIMIANASEKGSMKGSDHDQLMEAKKADMQTFFPSMQQRQPPHNR